MNTSRIPTVRLRFLILLLVGSGLLTLTGCRQRAGVRLLGEWAGRPDTAEARAAREAEKYGDATTEFTTADRSDWETYDVRVHFNFSSPDRLEMSLADGTEALVGRWRVLETLPTGCTIEVFTTDRQTAQEVMRRFRLEFDERNGQLVGFLLTEAGADRGLGALYFSRPE